MTKAIFNMKLCVLLSLRIFQRAQEYHQTPIPVNPSGEVETGVPKGIVLNSYPRINSRTNACTISGLNDFPPSSNR